VLLPEPDDARLALAATLGAFEPCGGLQPLQATVLHDIAARVYRIDLDDRPVTPLDIDAVAGLDAAPELRQQAVHLMAILELIADPVPRNQADTVERYADALGVHLSLLDDARHLANHHVALMYADLQRSSWYTEQTVKQSLHGRFRELVRSKLAYTGLTPDRAIARKWEALRDLPSGSWGRGVADFYERHHFPFPGERHGIYELGARHDFVHVLADYDATPEGELDVFAFIAACMPDEKGLVLLAVTIGLFQNGAIHHVAGKRVKIARTDTLADPGAAARWAEALDRGRRCPVDVMGGIDHFALAPMPLDEVRARLGVLPTTLAPPPP
jgi:hypothetical protein